ncbi:DUF393 domain-containing protein [bacterium]|nr:MAG: DUF393 domain-containing protein [bacterium]
MSDLLIFDGDCGICTFFSEFVQKKTVPEQLIIKPYQVLNLREIHPELNEDRTSKSLYLLTSDSKLFNRSKGVFETMRRMRGIYKVFGYFLSNPIFVLIFNPLYDWIAKNRTKISIYFGLKACNISKYN